ncbi:universal stress protein [Streptomyces sp. SCSIO ZS0520]|uniref:universal stress protein n=1 Tax=Streptomyces sp. SCSIO ZS0520 TaxID=2892996 RepID=UPI0021DB460C|nr:universal stress protein [Streptomyces sp. SCSIO ZS0520]
MAMNADITVGLDGTPESLAAADWAAREARARGAGLRLLHAWVLLEPEGAPGDSRTGVAEEDRNHWAKKTVTDAEHLLEEAYPGLPLSTELVAADPESALLDAARECALLVLGSQGLGRTASYLLGAVALRVVARSAAPAVLVRAEPAEGSAPVPHAGPADTSTPSTGPGAGGLSARPDDLSGLGDPDEPGGRDPAGRTTPAVLVGVSPYEPAAAEVLDFAFAMADRHSAPVHAVHVRQLPVPIYAQGDPALAPALVEKAVNGSREQLRAALAPWRDRYPRVPVRETVRPGSAARILVGESAGARLLVVGRRRHPARLRPRLGHVVQAVAHHAPCPLAVVPHD